MKMKLIETWWKFLLLACVVAVAIDPLFHFIPEIDSTKSCFTFEKKLGRTVGVLRTFIDTFYLIYIIYYFIIEVTISRSPKSGRRELYMLSNAGRRKHFLFYLLVDIVSVLPIPQVVVLSVIIRSNALVSKSILISFTKWIIVIQYIPRIIRIYPIYKNVTRTSGTIAESKWIGAALNLSLFLLFSYVFGALWYVNGVEKKTRCWRETCRSTPGCNLTMDLFCAKDINNSHFLSTSCPLINPDEITNSTVYNFGMYIEVLKSGVVEVKPRDFPRKFVYCFWWGLRNLSTFGQGLIPTNSASDSFFAITVCVSGLFLFAVLIGNVQKYMIYTVRLEEMKARKRDTEKWMSSRNLPDNLKKRIRNYDTYKWREFRGMEEEALLLSLPKDLRLDTKCYLYLDLLLNSVPLLHTLDVWVLETVCDRVKSVFYSKNSYIVKEGHPVEEMLIVTKGTLDCKIRSSARANHYDISQLKEGDICGDLHSWILNPTLSPHISNRTIMTLTDVEGFILSPDDLQFLVSHLDRDQIVKYQELFISLSEKQRSGGSSSPDLLLPVPQRSDDPEFSNSKHYIIEGNVSDEIKSV